MMKKKSGVRINETGLFFAKQRTSLDILQQAIQFLENIAFIGY